jgi:hypothetical protein
MEIGIGLPATIPGVTGSQLTDWARRADEAGFSTLATLDRLVYPNYEYPASTPTRSRRGHPRRRTRCSSACGPSRRSAATR